MKKSLFLFCLLFIFLGTSALDAQCAMCRAVLESEESGAAAKGINHGIMYLMVFPYILMAGLGYYIYRSRKKLRKSKPEV